MLPTSNIVVKGWEPRVVTRVLVRWVLASALTPSLGIRIYTLSSRTSAPEIDISLAKTCAFRHH